MRYQRPEDARTRIARLRIERGISQQRLSQVTGISLSTLARLERGQVSNPPLRYLINISISLDVTLDELIEDEWREWMGFAPWAKQPPPKDWVS